MSKSQIEILLNGRLSPDFESVLAAEFDLCPLRQQHDRSEFLKVHGRKFKGLVTNGIVGADADLIAALPSLQVIASRGVGYDKIDLEAVKNRGIALSNTPDVLTDCVADMALGALIAVARGLILADRYVRRGDWLQQKFPLKTKVSRKKLGVVGMGRIGRAVARRAAGFDMDIRYHSRMPKAELSWSYMDSLCDLAHWADFLMICTPGGVETRHLVGAGVLMALGPKGILINVARGSVVDESALIQALVKGQIAGAALDVFENEPRVPDQLLALEQVVLLPHIASSTHETFAAMENLVLENLQSFFCNGHLVTPVNEVGGQL